jgi:hypothetical protein
MEFIYYTLQKDGSEPGENEDRTSWNCNGTTGHAVFATSDGSTGSSFSRIWAGFLVTGFCASPVWDGPGFRLLLQKCAKKRLFSVSKEDLPYYGILKAEMGSDATFLGLELVPDLQAWHCIAFGDTTLIQVRNSLLVTSFPMKYSKDFSSHPFLLSSIERKNNSLWNLFDTNRNHFLTEGTYGQDDRFIIMSDALASWFLTEFEQGKSPFDELEPVLLGTPGALPFSTWIQRKREERVMKNDDTTCLVVIP